MSEPTIICPNCKTEIKLTESLADSQIKRSVVSLSQPLNNQPSL